VRSCLVPLLFALVLPVPARAQHASGGDGQPLPYYAIVPETYHCVRTAAAPRIDGRIDDAVWARAAWTNDFVDIQGDMPGHEPAVGAPRFRTRVKMLWDDRAFYFAAELEEPHVSASLLMRDTVIFRDNDFEIFVDPDGDHHRYYEFEMNAYNTVWDLFLPKPYRDGGPADNSWDIRGLASAVAVDGTINDARDTDRGWTLEVAIPWSAFDRCAQAGRTPAAGDTWRVNFSRVEWRYTAEKGRYVKVPGLPEDNWVWSAQGVIDMHRPEKWGEVRFVDRAPEPYRIDATTGRQLTGRAACTGALMQLFRVYWAQKAYQKAHGRWAATLGDLALDHADVFQRQTPVRLRMTKQGGWECETSCNDEILVLDHQSRLHR
jgi:hypothetical protein